MQKYIIPIIALILAITGCQKIVDADSLLDTGEKVFIKGYISPQDTVLRVHVSRVFPSIGTPLKFNDEQGNLDKFLIKDAEVTIADEGGNSTQLQFSSEENNFLADASSLAILENQSYFLKVIADGEEYNVSCTIPKKIETINEAIELRTDEFGDERALIRISFQDILGEKNFYALGGKVIGTFTYEGEEPQPFEYGLFFDSDEFITDAIEDGGTITGISEDYYVGGSELETTTFTLQVGHMEEVLFQNLRASSINSESEGNPFVEYSIAPDNILGDGAVGVFAGYNLTEKTIAIDL